MNEASVPAPHPPLHAAPRRATLRFMLANPLHALALGFGSGLSPKAPGTVGTLWAWLAFLVLQPRLGARGAGPCCWPGASSSAAGPARSRRARLGLADPGCIVWDEVIAFWLVLWLVMPAGLLAQGVAFALFRFFDAAKPGPVAWADALFKPRHGADRALQIGWAQGLGIMLDDLVAALCTLLVIALWRFW